MTSSSHNSKLQARKLLDFIQLNRNLAQVKQTMPGIPTEPPERWLAHVIVQPVTNQELLAEALQGKVENWKAKVLALYSSPAIQQIAGEGSLDHREVAVLKLMQSCKMDLLVQKLKSSGVQNVDAWARDLAKVLGDVEAYYDYYLEAEYALYFANKFLVTLKPTGQKGPDLKVDINGAETYVEVSRFREDNCLRTQMEQSTKMVRMPQKDQNVLAKIDSESKQLVDGMPGIVLLHTNNVGISERDFQRAIAYKATPLARASAIIFRDTWRKLEDNYYPVCWGFINGSATIQIQPKMLQKIGQCLDPNFKILTDT